MEFIVIATWVFTLIIAVVIEIVSLPFEIISWICNYIFELLQSIF